MYLPFELVLALRYLRFHRGRTFLSVITLISIAGVTVGTAALIIALSLMAGFVQDVRARIHSGSAHLTVMATDRSGVFEGAEALVQRLQAAPGVNAAAPVLYTPALITFEAGSTHGFTELHGVDPPAHARVILGSAAADDPFASLAQATGSGRDGILLGQGLASELGAAEGDLVRLLVPSVSLAPWGAGPRSRVLEVVGRYRSEHFQEDAMRAYVALKTARDLLRSPGASSWVEVRLDDLEAIEPMKQRLRQSLSPGWLVIDLIEQNRDILRALHTEKLILLLAIGLIVIVAALNIVSTLILMVAEKMKEIGTLTAMGARPAEIARVFMLQGSVIGVVGTLAGLTIGVAACFWLDRYEMIPLNPEVYFLNHIPFKTQPWDVLLVGSIALLISFLATLYPALKAARLDPVEAIRHE